MRRSVSPAPSAYLGVRVLMSDLDLGDPMDDLSVATVLMMVGGQLVLLRPRKVRIYPFPLEIANITPDSFSFLVCHARGPL